MSDGVVYEGQGLLDIKLDMEVDVSTASEFKIIYQKPLNEDGTEGEVGEWTATLEGTSTLVYQVQDGDIDVVGTWKFQPKVVVDERTGLGLITKIKFKQAL